MLAKKKTVTLATERQNCLQWPFTVSGSLLWLSPGQHNVNILQCAGLLEQYSAQQRLSGAEPPMLYLGLHMFRTTVLPLMWRDFVPIEYSFVPVCTGLF